MPEQLAADQEQAVIVLAIDPGYEQSAFVFYDAARRRLHAFGIIPNAEMRRVLLAGETWIDQVGPITAASCAIEKIAMGGMVAGQETFDTAMWVGRFVECWQSRPSRSDVYLVKRIDEKMHLCHDSRAKDANIRTALLDKFGPGKERAIGTKKAPGPLYGVTSHVWSALAVAITFAEGGCRERRAA